MPGKYEKCVSKKSALAKSKLLLKVIEMNAFE